MSQHVVGDANVRYCEYKFGRDSGPVRVKFPSYPHGFFELSVVEIHTLEKQPFTIFIKGGGFTLFAKHDNITGERNLVTVEDGQLQSCMTEMHVHCHDRYPEFILSSDIQGTDGYAVGILLRFDPMPNPYLQFNPRYPCTLL